MRPVGLVPPLDLMVDQGLGDAAATDLSEPDQELGVGSGAR